MSLSPAEMQAAIDKFTINMVRLNSITNGDVTTEVAIDSGTVPSIAKFFDEIGTTAAGYAGQSIAARDEAVAAKNLANLWAESPTAVTPGHYSAKYWADIASGTVTGVASFNGRAGNVTAQLGDYPANLIGYTGSVANVQLKLDELTTTSATNTTKVNTALAETADLRTSVSTLALMLADTANAAIGYTGGFADEFATEDNLTFNDGGIDEYTASCLHLDAIYDTYGLTDSGIKQRSWQVFGGATIDTTNKKFGAASLKCISSPVSYIVACDAQTAGDNLADRDAYTFGTGDFTIDVWVYFNALQTNNCICDFRTSSNAETGPVMIVGSTKFNYYYASATRIAGTTTIVTGQWYHMALDRYNGVTKLFLNGAQEGPQYADLNNYAQPTNGPIFGATSDRSGAPVNANFDEIRISKGVSRYKGQPFTPPSAPYTENQNNTYAQQYDATNDWYSPQAPRVVYGTDTTTSAQAISGGDNASGSYPKGRAFDNDILNGVHGWASLQQDTGVSGNAYIGQDYGAGVTKNIRRVKILQYVGNSTSITQAAFQYSDNGSTWTTAKTILNLQYTSIFQTYEIPDCGAHRYWRLLAQTNPATSNSWGVTELEFQEALTPATQRVMNEQILSVNQPNYTNYNFRQRIGSALLLNDGKAVRLKLRGVSSGNSMQIDDMWIGHRAASGDLIDMDGNQRQVTVNGSKTFTLVNNALLMDTDWVPFNLDKTKDLIICWHSVSGDQMSLSTNTSADLDVYQKIGASEASLSDVRLADYTLVSVDLLAIWSIESTANFQNMNLLSRAFTALTTPVRGTITFQTLEPLGALTPNTDFVVEMSRNGGTNWTTVPVTLTANWSGVKMYTGEVSLTAQPTGTQVRWRVRNLTNKFMQASGIAVAWDD